MKLRWWGACSPSRWGSLLPGAPPAAAEDEAVIETSFEVPTKAEPDGKPVTLDTSVLTTDPGAARPTIVLAHGFGGSKADSADVGRTLARDGYTVITYTARGFGKSGGRIHLDNPAYEGADTRSLINFAVERPEVAKTGTDPVIGFAGASYGGAASILAAGLDARVDAIVPAFTWHSLTQALVPQYAVSGTQSSAAYVSPVGTPGTFKERWAALFFGAGQGRSGVENGNLCGRFAPEICRAYVQTAQLGRPAPGLHRPARPIGPGPGPGQDQRADLDRPRRGRHPLPAGPGRRQLRRIAGLDHQGHGVGRGRTRCGDRPRRSAPNDAGLVRRAT